MVFDGYKEKDPRRIIFLDVKTGKTAALSPVERKLKHVVEQGKVEWETVHVDTFGEEAEKFN
ncbi:MAG TPA: hypothetical protein EYP46_00565 [Hadesarchaea archaeon]|nr:hypothetical protein [Hadesarchaea archaeon]